MNNTTDDATRLRREIAGLEAELAEAKEKAAMLTQASRDATVAIRNLRKITQPLYDVLRMIHGEMDRVSAEAIDSEYPTSTPTKDHKWDHWKQQLGPKAANFIDALLVNRRMTITQLSKSGQCSYGTAKTIVQKMRGVGIAVSDNSGVTLK